jgi:uncharacterized protein (TIGR04255 family)
VLPPGSQALGNHGWLPLNWTGISQYTTGDERYLVLRHGPQPAIPGFAINPDGPLKRLGPQPVGPFFLLDFDAFWQPSVIPDWDPDITLQTCDELRKPIRTLFDEIITDRLISSVFDQEVE